VAIVYTLHFLISSYPKVVQFSVVRLSTWCKTFTSCHCSDQACFRVYM